MKTIKIVWQRLLDEHGATCDRCGDTEKELDKAVRFLQKTLAPAGVRFAVEKNALDLQEVTRDPSRSNRIWIDGRPLEKWLGAEVGKSPCCGPCQGLECRTLEKNGAIHETIPAELIIKGGLLAVQRQVNKISGKQP
ncbi:MAG: DUF2703 domain-containing protein [Syntrophobacterales bacterium]|jgi:hypothetical protein